MADAATRAAVVRMRKAGEKVRTIARLTNLPLVVVAAILKDAGLVKAQTGMPPRTAAPVWACPRCGGRAGHPNGHPRCAPLHPTLYGVTGLVGDLSVADKMMAAHLTGETYEPPREGPTTEDECEE